MAFLDLFLKRFFTNFFILPLLLCLLDSLPDHALLELLCRPALAGSTPNREPHMAVQFLHLLAVRACSLEEVGHFPVATIALIDPAEAQSCTALALDEAQFLALDLHSNLARTVFGRELFVLFLKRGHTL